MRYPATVSREGKFVLAFFPDCPGCQTQADPGERIEDQAAEALQGWLQAHLLDGEAPPRPSTRSPRARRGEKVHWVEVPLKLAVKLVVRWARQDAGLTQARLAKLAGISQPMIAKLEAPDSNPTVETLDRVFAVLKVHPDFGLPGQHHV
jgi:predicted RNase H-like HicB family nuclease/DNA-binding XRE family transcriptional regulator